MKSIIKIRTRSMKKLLLLGVFLSASNIINAQSASWDQNTAPIFPVANGDNAAFGWRAMNNGACGGTGNTATGYYALNAVCSGEENTANGKEALLLNIAANRNTGIGFRALYNTNTSGNGGHDNTGVGHSALILNDDGEENTSVGNGSLHDNVNGFFNTAVGFNALYSNNAGVAGDGDENTGVGHGALFTNSAGNRNTAMGKEALFGNTSSQNTGIGYRSLYNTTAQGNTGVGHLSLYTNTGGSQNAAIGDSSLFTNNNGVQNTACGASALLTNDGDQNTGAGFMALHNNSTGSYNTAFGTYALYNNTTGDTNTAIGFMANVSTSGLSKATALGAGAIVNATKKVRIGSTNVTVVETAVAYSVSDGRFKTNISESDVKGLEFIKKLRPVVYNFDTKKFTEFLTKNMSDNMRQKYLADDFTASTAIRQSGFIAQEVEKAAKETGYNFNGVHVPDNSNDNYSLAYGQFVVPLVKGMQEQQAMIDNLNNQVSQQNQLFNDLLKKSSSLAGIKQMEVMTPGFYMDAQPNPFNEETIVKFSLPGEVSNAYLTIYDLSGKRISLLALNDKNSSSVTISSGTLSAGMYFYSIVADGKVMGTKRLIVLEK